MSTRNKKGNGTKAEQKRERLTLGEALTRSLDLPPDILPHGTLIEIRGRSSLTLCGCTKILHYSPELMRFSLGKHGSLRIEGSSLFCTSYHTGAVGIDGKICSVSFEDGE